MDAGYNFVIVLTGLTNKLRFQTQSRLKQDLLNHYPHQWSVLTLEDEAGDFRSDGGGFNYHPGIKQLQQ